MSKYRALVWEQTRVAGVLSLWCLIVAFVAMNVFEMLWTDAEFGLYVVSVLFGIAFVFTRDAQGHLRTAFEPRLLSMPIQTLPLTAIIFAVRVICLIAPCYAMGLWLEMYVKYSDFHPVDLAWPIFIYAIAQTVAWTRNSIRVTPYLLLVVILLFPVIWQSLPERIDAVAPPPADGQLEEVDYFSEEIWPLLRWFPLLLGAYAFSALGVYWERRDLRHGPPKLTDLYSRLTRRQVLAVEFATPAAAQVWYEEMRAGRMMSVLTLLFSTFFMSVYDIRLIVTPQVVPLAAFALAALITGMALRTPRCGYPFVRPLRTRDLATAKMRALGRALLRTVPLVATLSISGFLIFGGLEREVLWSGIARGEVALSELIAIFLGPVLIAAFAAWLLLWLLSRNSMAVLLSSVIGFFVVMNLEDPDGYAEIELAMTHAVWATVAIGGLFISLSFAQAWRKGHVSHRQILLCLVATSGLAILLMIIGPPGLPAHETFILAAVPGLLCVLPVAALPLSLQRKRVA
jgi:hypothetical protein